jgi:hypothetical protein
MDIAKAGIKQKAYGCSQENKKPSLSGNSQQIFICAKYKK